MILVYPLLLAIALAIVRRERNGSAGWSGFALWTAAGAVFTLSLVAGFSFGLLLLPLVVLAGWLALRQAANFRAMRGFLAGVALVVLIVALL